MKTRGSLLSLSLLLIGFCVAIFAFEDSAVAQQGRKGTGIVPLNEDETRNTLHIREEEKLARDVYMRMHDIWGATVFSNIAVSEQRHMDAVLNLLDKYGIPDPALGEGNFANSDLQKLYDDLIKQGKESLLNAFEVGVIIEETDIEDLQEAIEGTQKADLEKVYGNLLNGSYNHLDAFNYHSDSLAQ